MAVYKSSTISNANLAGIGTKLTFGSPFSADVAAAAAQSAAQTVSPPIGGKTWQRLQVFVRWATGSEGDTAVVVMYWYDGTNWNDTRWPIYKVESTTSASNKRLYSNYTEIPFPGDAVSVAVGIEDYTAGTFYVDLLPLG